MTNLSQTWLEMSLFWSYLKIIFVNFQIWPLLLKIEILYLQHLLWNHLGNFSYIWLEGSLINPFSKLCKTVLPSGKYAFGRKSFENNWIPTLVNIVQDSGL
jgi:hypothetical protein